MKPFISYPENVTTRRTSNRAAPTYDADGLLPHHTGIRALDHLMPFKVVFQHFGSPPLPFPLMFGTPQRHRHAVQVVQYRELLLGPSLGGLGDIKAREPRQLHQILLPWSHLHRTHSARGPAPATQTKATRTSTYAPPNRFLRFPAPPGDPHTHNGGLLDFRQPPHVKWSACGPRRALLLTSPLMQHALTIAPYCP